MPKFNPTFYDVKLARCDVCGRVGKTDRHHIRREKLFIEILKTEKIGETDWYKALVKRYNEFRPSDVRPLCSKCHKEIHEKYNEFLREWNFENGGIPIEWYTKSQVMQLMMQFRACYFAWREWKRWATRKKEKGK